jgi:hypothetical protein
MGFKASAPCYFSHPTIFTFDSGADINLRPGKVSALRSDRGSNSRLPERQSSVGTKEHQVPSYTDLQT